MKKMIIWAVLGLIASLFWACDKSPFSVNATCSGDSFSYRKDNVIVLLPAVFSPNGDGVNDSYTAYAAGVSTFSMKIYDRYGRLLYESQDKNAGWNGTYKGKKMPDGEYFAVFRFSMGNVPVNKAVTLSMFSGTCVPAGFRGCQFPDQLNPEASGIAPTREVFCR